MKKRHFFSDIWIVKIITLFILSSCKSNQASELKGARPNIVFILADDMGWADLPVYGNTFNEAPNLSQMAVNGIRFTNAYAAGPVCSPTRASIIAGQYPPPVSGLTPGYRVTGAPMRKLSYPRTGPSIFPLRSIPWEKP